MIAVNWKDMSLFVGFILGFITGIFGLVLLSRIASWIELRKRGKYEKFKMGDDLFDVKIPDFMPKDKDNQD